MTRERKDLCDNRERCRAKYKRAKKSFLAAENKLQTTFYAYDHALMAVEKYDAAIKAIEEPKDFKGGANTFRLNA